MLQDMVPPPPPSSTALTSPPCLFTHRGSMAALHPGYSGPPDPSLKASSHDSASQIHDSAKALTHCFSPGRPHHTVSSNMHQVSSLAVMISEKQQHYSRCVQIAQPTLPGKVLLTSVYSPSGSNVLFSCYQSKSTFHKAGISDKSIFMIGNRTYIRLLKHISQQLSSSEDCSVDTCDCNSGNVNQ